MSYYSLNSWIKCALSLMLLVGCGGSSSNVPTPAQDGNQSPLPKIQANAKQYWFKTGECDTGNHLFNDEDADRLLEQYCGSLVDDHANNFCAEESRLEQFNQHCLPIVGKFPQVTLLANGRAAMAVKLDGSKGVSAQKVELELLSLWADKNEMVLTAEKLAKIKTAEELEQFAPEETIEFVETENLISAAADCGLSYRGPRCSQFESGLRQASGLIKSGNSAQISYYHVSLYPGVTGLFLWEFPLVAANESLQSTGKVNLFLVNRGTSKASLFRPDLSSHQFTKVAAFQVSTIDEAGLYEKLDKSVSTRQLVNLSSQLLSRTIIDSEELARRKSTIHHQLKRHDQLLLGETDYYQIHDYMEILSKVSENEGVLQADLKKLSESDNERVSIESAVKLVEYQPQNRFLLKRLGAAFSLFESNPRLVVDAISVVKRQPLIKLTENDVNKVARLMKTNNAAIIDAAYELLAVVGVSDSTLPTLVSMLNQKSLSDEMRHKVVNLTATIDSNDAKTAIIESLARFSPDYLPDQYSVLYEKVGGLTLNDMQVPALVALLDHPKITTRLRSVDWLIAIHSQASLNGAIEGMNNIDYLVRNYITDRLEKIELGKEFVPKIVSNWYSFEDVTSSVIRLLDVNKSDEAKNELIDKIDESSSHQSDIQARLDRTRLNDINAPNLGKKLRSQDEQSRWAALEFLGRIKTIGSTAVLVENMSIDDTPMRAKLLETVLAEREVKDSLITALENNFKSDYLDTILATIELLGRINTTQSMRANVKYMCSPAPEVRNAIYQQLFSRPAIGDLGFDFVDATAKCPYVSVRQTAINYLDRSDHYRHFQALYRLVAVEVDADIRSDIIAKLDKKPITTNIPSSILADSIKNSPYPDIQVALTKYFGPMLKIQWDAPEVKESDRGSALIFYGNTQAYVFGLQLQHPNPVIREMCKNFLVGVNFRTSYDMKAVMDKVLVESTNVDDKILALSTMQNIFKNEAAAAKDQGIIDTLKYQYADLLDKRLTGSPTDKTVPVETDAVVRAKLQETKDLYDSLVEDMKKRLPPKPKVCGSRGCY